MNITDNTFQSEVLDRKGVVLVDFWASWCPPCKMMKPLVEQFADEHTGRVAVYMLNIDQNAATAMQFGISSVPTFVAFADGKEVARGSGAKTKNQLLALVDSACANREAA